MPGAEGGEAAKAPRPWWRGPVGIIVAAGTALLLLLGISMCSARGDDTASSDTGGVWGGSKVGTSKGDPTVPVKALFEGMQKGDSKEVLDAMSTQPRDTALITDAVLAQLAKDSPITDVQVTKVDDYKAQATWSMLGQSHTDSFSVFPDSSGTYKLSMPSSLLSLSGVDPSDVTVMLDGVKLEDSTATALPGRYRLAVDPKYKLSRPTVDVTKFSGLTSASTTLGLSDATQTSLRSAAAKQLAACMAAKQLDNPDCGINFQSSVGGEKLDPKTLACSVVSGGNTVSNATFKPGYPVTDADAEVSVHFSCKVRSTAGEQYTGKGELYRASADLSKNPAAITFR